MKQGIRTKMKENREKGVKEQTESLMSSLQAEGYEVRFGYIGEKTTYAFLKRGEEEIVGYTFIRDIRFKNEAIGKLKALQQAVTRKNMLEQESEESSAE